MVTPLRFALLGILASLCAVPVVHACGDKLLAIGGGVSFERVFSSHHPGNLILFISPLSPLRAANDELRLDSTLERAGHTVRKVSSREELETSLRIAAADLIVADWEDAQSLGVVVGERVAILPVLAGAAKAGSPGCLVNVSKRKGREVAHAVDQFFERSAKGLPPRCVIADLAAG